MIFHFIREKKPAGNFIAIVIYTLLSVITVATVAICLQAPFSLSSPLFFFIIFSIASLVLGFMVYKENALLKKRNQLLQAQQQYLQNAANNVNEGIIVTDDTACIYYMNPAAEKITASTLQNAKSKPLQQVYKIFNQSTGEPVENAAIRVLKSGVAIVDENNTVLTNSRKQKIVIKNTCNPLHNSNGDVCGTVLIFKECIPISNTQVQEKYNQNIIQHLPQAVYTCSENGNIQSYNDACVALWGREPQPGKEKWCCSKKLFYADGTPVPHENSPMALAIKHKRTYEAAEIILQQDNGQQRNIIMHAAPLFDNAGKLTGAVNMMMDVTEKKYKERAARYNEYKYYTLLDHASEAIFITDSEGNLLETNMQASVITGYKKHELRDMNIAKLFPKNDFENNFQVFKKVLDGEEKITKELVAIHKNKHPLWVAISAKKLPDGRIMAIVNDITELKQTAKSLEESEQLNTSILTSVTAHIGVINEHGIVVTCNKAWNEHKNQFGKTVLERCEKGENFVIATQLDAACGDKTAACILEGLNEVRLKKIEQFEHEYICPLANEVRWFAVRLNPFADNAAKVVITHVDITETKKAENETGNYRFALNQSCIMDVADSNGVIIDANDNFYTATGFTKEEVIGQTHNILDSGYHDESFYKNLWNTIAAGKVWAGEIKNRRKNGETFWVNTTIVPCLNVNGKPVQYISMRLDISQRKAAEEKMREAMERYAFLSEATSDTIWDWNIENGTMLYNEAITPMLGYLKPEVSNINEWWKQNIHKDDIEAVTKEINLAFEAQKTSLKLEYRFRCENGSYKYIFDRAFVVYDNTGKAVRMIGAMQDVTYQKQEEQRISKAVMDAQEAERQYLGMELHDNINQLLTGTLLMLSAAAHEQMSKSDVHKLAGKCKDHLTNAVNEIRNLSHRLSPAAFTTSLQHEFILLMNQMSSSAGISVAHNINITNENLMPAEIKICLYRILQEQLSNICKHSKASNVQVSLIQYSNSVFLKIKDNGVGFNDIEMTNGIGLANIKKRVGYFSGKLNIIASSGNGCIIEAELPYTDATAC